MYGLAFSLVIACCDPIWLTITQLYYNKRSQFLSGVEAEKVDVSVGQNVDYYPRPRNTDR